MNIYRVVCHMNTNFLEILTTRVSIISESCTRVCIRICMTCSNAGQMCRVGVISQSLPSFSPVNSTIWSIPSYTSTSNPYFRLTSGGTNRPPRNCRPLKCWTHGFGAVREINACGWNPLPGPSGRGPFSTSQDEGISTDNTGIDVDAIA